jgi:hypothetical protein
MALCALIPGTPMVYHLQESGLAPYLERLYALRRNLPALHSGEADFLSVTCDRPPVLTVLRTLGRECALGVINLSSETQACTLQIPSGAAVWGKGVRDALASSGAPPLQVETSGAGDCVIRLTLGPYEAAVLLPSASAFPIAAPVQVTPPAPPPTPLSASRQAGDVVVEGSGLKLTVNGVNGLLKSLEYAGAPVLRCLSLGEGPRRLWLGARKLALESAGGATVEIPESAGGTVAVRARGAISDAGGNAAAEYAVTYTTLLRDARPQVTVAYEITARRPVENVLGSLVELLAFDPAATEWAVGTVEGTLHDWNIPRWPADRRYEGRYVRGVGDRVWELADQVTGLPVHIAVRSPSGWWTQMSLGDGRPLPANAALKLRRGEETGPFLQVEWLDGASPVDLKVGDTLRFGYVLHLGLSGERPPDLSPAALRSLPAGWLRITGSQMEAQNGSCYLRTSRYGGGRINAVAESAAAPPLVSGSRVYTDWGIYPDEITPDMRQVHRMVTSDADPETVARVALGGPEPVFTFGGYLRDSDGRSTPWPRTEYQVQYTLGGSAVRVKVGVRPLRTLPAASAFLAQTLGIPAFAKYTVAARDGIVTRDATGFGRVWESKLEGFGPEPFMEWRGAEGRGVRISGHDLAGIQNAFLLHSASGAGTAFLAFLDGLPADLFPQWRTLEYTLTPLKGAQ